MFSLDSGEEQELRRGIALFSVVDKMKRSVTYHFLLFSPLFPLLLFSYSFAQPSLALDTTEQYLECNATRMLTCGDVHTEIKFPFWTEDRLDYCGHPGYQLTCDPENKTLSMNIGDKSYHVRERIDYENQSLALIDADLSAAVTTTSFCRPEKITNTTTSRLELSYLTYGDNDINVILYLNCSISTILNLNKFFPIPCTSYFPDFFGQKAFFTLAKEHIELPENEQCNATVLIPVYDQFNLGDFITGAKNFSDVMKAGFGVKWTIGQVWCDKCTKSGGLCGSNDINPACFCPVGMTIGTICSHGINSLLLFFADLFSSVPCPELSC